LDVKSTDSGRPVYGGDGITPDEKYEPKYNKFQRGLFQHDRFIFFTYVAKWFGAHPSTKLPKGWEPDNAVLNDFHEYLLKQQVQFTEADWTENRTWLLQQLKREMYATAFSFEESQRVAAEADPMVLKAIESMPEAKALLDKSKKLIVMRTNRDGRADRP
jgi:carboxyl-terminal processing protease